ncbi:MAG: serine/threonine-protein kinase [Candidatus Melainabacteria bacterium]|nr:serine/threonine-protein kinase [Candidatus Melainabacteria bacterium]
MFYSLLYGFALDAQIFFGVAGLVFITAKYAPRATDVVRAKLELKAKGLDIRSSTINAIMPWGWLSKVEIRNRSFSFIPNYVYFQFKDKSDVLILWEDVRDDIDSITLVSCVRTWAPQAKIIGDANIAKAESIATYTELWLKDLSVAKTSTRLRRDQTLSAGTVLSDSYKIERILSGGGQGTAYLASALPNADFAGLPPHVVIKELILPANDRGLQKAKDSLTKEVAILRRIDHPQIIRLYDFFIEDMRGYLAIEFVDGLTLRQFVLQKGLPEEALVAKIGVSLCETISYLHALTPAIIHGDVTPDNIMIEKSGGIKLLDFDAAQELSRNKTNTVVGKHSYMSPEQFRGMLDVSSDVYALGCTLHFLLTGTDPEPISESCPLKIVPNISEAMNQIVMESTRLNQSERFSNLNELRVKLERL